MNNRITNWIEKHKINDLKDKNIFITGGNSGIGFELALQCAYLRANIFLLIRSLEKGEIAKQKIIKEYPEANVILISLDLASFSSIRKCVEEIKKYDVYAFINNAGIYRLPKQNTIDGLDITMGTNFIGPLLLNDLLMPYFVSLNHDVYVEFVTSVTAKMSKIDYSNFYMDKKYKSSKQYARSKIAINNMFFNYIEEYQDTNLYFSLVHPGGTYTPLIKKGYRNKVFEKAACAFMRLFFHAPNKAALCLLWPLIDNKKQIVGPRGLFELPGYPKCVKFKKDKQYKYCVSYARNEIERIGHRE